LKFVISNPHFQICNFPREATPETSSENRFAWFARMGLVHKPNAGTRPRGIPTIHLPKNTNDLATTRNNRGQFFTAAAVIFRRFRPNLVERGERNNSDDGQAVNYFQKQFPAENFPRPMPTNAPDEIGINSHTRAHPYHISRTNCYERLLQSQRAARIHSPVAVQAPRPKPVPVV
jgi:hypothetical protein